MAEVKNWLQKADQGLLRILGEILFGCD